MKGIKIVDSSPDVTTGSRADLYWQREGWDEIFKKMRPGMKLPGGLKVNDPNVIARKFNLKGIGFGNWVTIEDRINYLYALVYAMYDLNKVLSMNFNLGLGVLTVTFGARGVGGHLAHYESGSDIINISRYKQGIFSPKSVRFLTTGGIGSLAHEYGHFMDYFAGGSFEKNNSVYALSGGSSVATDRVGISSPIRTTMDEILERLIWKVPGKVRSRFYARLLQTLEAADKGEYWIRRNELFARTFEAWVLWKLKQTGIRNYLLTSSKYTPQVYPNMAEIKALDPLLSKFIKQFKTYI